MQRYSKIYLVFNLYAMSLGNHRDEHRRKGDVCTFLRHLSLSERLESFATWPHESPAAVQVFHHS
jgi:hypothetical protein